MKGTLTREQTVRRESEAKGRREVGYPRQTKWGMQAKEATGREDCSMGRGNPAHDDAMLGALLNHVTCSILISTMEQARSVKEISRDSEIPLSTCYERVAELQVRGILRREKIIVTQTGKRYALYRTAIRAVYVEFGSGGPNVTTVANEDKFDESRSMAECLV